MNSHSTKYFYYFEKFKTEGIPIGLEGLKIEPGMQIASTTAYVMASIEIWGPGQSGYETRCRHEINHDGHPSKIDRHRHLHPLF
jgi:hypothetical protein